MKLRGKMMLKNNERLDDLQINGKFVIQNPDEYCFTSDAVQLANFANVKPNDKVVDLCSGSGVIGILIQTKTNCQDITLVELQEYMADMSRRSVEYNNQQEYIAKRKEKILSENLSIMMIWNV